MEQIEATQSLHDLINKIERICVGFDDHKQETYNLVQSVKALYLYSQTPSETVEEYARNSKSLWDTAVAFGASPGRHKKLIQDVLRRPVRDGGATDPDNPTDDEMKKAEEVVNEEVRACLLFSGSDKN